MSDYCSKAHRDFRDATFCDERWNSDQPVHRGHATFVGRPVHEVLFSRDQDMSAAFENEFVGMTRTPITVAELGAVRRKLKKELPGALTANQRQFLIGLFAGEPEWTLMKCPHLLQLPAIRWKLQNLAKLKKSNPRKFSQQADELRARLAV